MKRRTALAALVLLTACGQPHKLHNGIVVSKSFSKAYDEHGSVCVSYGKYGCAVSVPTTTHHDAEFFLNLSDCFETEHEGCRHEEFEVTEGAWNQTNIGDKWSDGSGKANES